MKEMDLDMLPSGLHAELGLELSEDSVKPALL